jgi:hypothetical protein
MSVIASLDGLEHIVTLVSERKTDFFSSRLEIKLVTHVDK